MIHPFAQFNAANTSGLTLQERAVLLDRPAAEFAAFLQRDGGQPAGPQGIDAGSSQLQPQRAALSYAAASVSATVVAQAPDIEPAGNVRAQTAGAAPDDATAEQAPNPGSGAGPSLDPPPSVLSFPDVPDSVKFPAGPYRQAPPEYGGQWWLANPFTGGEPWLTQGVIDPTDAGSTSNPYATENLPQDFMEAFGEKPAHRSGESGVDFQARTARWKQDLEFFQRIGIPEGFDESQVDLAASNYEQWDMGRPVFYEGRYGWCARFPDSAIPEFEMDAASAINASHLAIARFQVRLLQQGITPGAPHPFVPPHLLSQDV